MKKWLTYMVLLLCMGHVWGQTYHVGDLYTAPDGSQGIVYYLNPDGSGGWVVALSDASTGCYWDWENPSDIPGLQNYTSDYLQVLLNDTSGYQNTQTIRNFLNDPYSAAGIVDFDNGWVLPSPAQLRMLYAQLPFVSAALEAAGGADLADATYWTSAEKDGNFAWSVVFSTGFSGYFYANVKGSTFCRVRAVRSFTYEPTYVWSTGDTASSITVSPEQTNAYAVTATTLIGCSDSADQTVTVLHYDTTHLYEAACDSYLWYGDSLVQSGEYSHTLTATTGCDSVVTLHLTVSHSDTTFLTETACGQYVWYNDTLTQSGEYTYTLANAIGCDSVLRLQLTVIPLPVLSHTLDTVIINGTSATLWASGADYLYWTDGNDSILSSGSSLTVSPGTTTVYYISGQNGDPTAGDNLLVNGDFEAGNTGFSSAYTYVTLQSTYNDYGRYYIIQDGHLVWGPSNLHGYGGSGLFMLVDGATTPNSVIWQQTVDVIPNTYYAFSAQIASTGYSNMYSSYAWLQFSINGTQLGPVFHSPSVLNSWQQYYEVWYSGNNTSATLTLLNQNTTSEGNDFGLDDISFTPLTDCFVTDSILVVVSGYPDNVDSADCTFLPEGTEWGIGQPIISGTIASMCASVPLVGDIDDDGQQEIVMHTNSKVLVFNPDATLKNQFNIASSQQEGQLGLAKVQYGQGDYKTIIVSYSSSNKYFYAYDANGTLLWQSDHPFTSHNGEQSQMPAISFADFNHDGWTEMYAGAEIYDAATGVLLCKANGNKGHAGRTWATNYSTYQSSAADMCDDFDLELVVGNTVYSVDIQSRTDVSLNSVSSIRTLDASEMTMADGTTIPFSDGNTFLVDVNLDGQLDVLVMNVDQLNRVIYLYVWDVVSQSIICSKRIDNARKFGMPQIGDLDNDGFPEICFIVGTYNDHQPGNNETIYALKYNAQSQAEEMDVLWTTSHSDFSGATSLTLFDFNQDGYSELVYRDENHLRIINGSMYNHLTGEAVTSPYDLATYPCGSGTALEYPIVCDVDLDGAAEIIIGSSCSSSTHYGHLYIFKSAGVPWAPARKVWNQYMYNVTNVNEDLTIPQYLFNNATAFTDPEGVVRRPFNNFLQQATNIDQYGRSFYPVPDVVVNGADIQDDGDSVLVTINYCNSGDNTLNAPYTISVFANAYGGDTVCTVTVDESLPVDSCTQSYIQVPLSSLCGFQTLDSLAVAVNCAGTGIAQNGGQQPECDTTNNTATIAVTLPTDSTHLFETACDSYLWYGDSLVQSGEYPHTLTATTGCDSVVIMHLTVNHSTAQTFPLTILENDLPYSFLDTTFYAAGTYVLTLENEFGCDSILTVVLSVFENVSNEVDSLICEGELPFVWNGVEFTQAGTQPAVLTAASGADSVVLMTVTLIPTTYGTFDTAVVENALPWQFHNLVCDSAGVYVDTLENVAGCDSVLTLNLTVWPNVTATAYDTVCEGELPFTWNDSIFTEAGTKTTTILAHTGADSTVTMILTVIPTTYGTFDTTVVENALPLHYHNLVCDSAGVYTDTLENVAGCDSILTLNLSFWPNVTSNQDSAVCIDAFPVIWNDSIFTEAGTKTTTILAYTGADSTITMTVTVIPTTYGIFDTTVVENALPWHLHNLVCDSAGVYTDTITNAAGCDSVLTVNLMVWPNVTFEQDSAVCEGDFPFTWNDSVFLGADVKTTTIPAHTGADSTITMIVTVIPTTYGTFDTAVVENALPWQFHNLVCDSAGVFVDTLENVAGCDSILTLNLTVWPNVTNQLDTTICESELPFDWNGVEFTAAGTDSVTLAAATGADSVVVMTVHVYPVTQYHIAGPGVICADSSVTLTADSAASYIWSTGETTQSITVDSVGYYSVSVTDGNGCTFTVDHYVRGIFDPIIEVNVDTIMCMGGTYTVTVGYQQGSSILLGDRVTTLSMTDTVFLPDGFPCEPYGCSYQSPLTFSAYAPGDTIESVDDIYYVRLNMEHSWIGDLYINITCPNGQKADLLKFGGFGTTECNASIQPSSQGWQAGANMQMNAFLGFANDYSVDTCDANAFGNEPGFGWNYCWSENTTQGYTYAPGEGSLIYRSQNQHYGIVDSSNVAAGTQFYHPDDPFSNLIGCPLNGSWFIEVMDGWGEDNGYIFGWELALSSEALPEATFTFDHSTVDGPWATAVSDSTFIIQPPADLDHDTTIVYVFTVYDTSGCSVDTSVTITFLSSVFTEKDTASCVSFEWNGVTYTASGEYQQTFVNANGCDSVVTLHLTVNLPEDTTVYASTVQNALPYHYVNGLIDTTFGTGIPMLTTSQFVFPSSNGCDSVVTLILTVYQNITTAVDTTVCAADLPYTWHGHTFTTAGSYPVTLLTSHGADSVVTYSLSVDNLAATVGNVTHVTCYGASTGAATVTATGGQTPLTCQWTNEAGTSVSTSSAISNRPAGTYTFTVTDHLGCTATATVTINTLNGELAPGTIAASQEVCDGEDIASFTGSAASGGDNGHYQWQISNNGTDWTNAPGTSTAQDYTYPNTASNAFTLRRAWVSQSCGTVYSNEVTVSVWPNSSDTITASVCQGEVYQDNGFNVTADETADAGEYTYEQHHATGHCDSAVILLLTVNPVAAELVEASVCEGEGYNENGFSVLPQETIGESELTRTLNLQSGQGCDSTVTLHLSVIDTSLRLVMLTDDFCEHQEASLSAVSPMPDYVWSTGETATTIVVTSPGLYSVTASEGGCSASASIRVEACHYELVLPNAITPSRGDGLNDSFFIPESFTGNINFFKIYIYNRWGELVFHSTDKNFRWSGEYRGQTQIQTVYNYVIEYTDMVGRPHKMVGTITVL